MKPYVRQERTSRVLPVDFHPRACRLLREGMSKTSQDHCKRGSVPSELKCVSCGTTIVFQNGASENTQNTSKKKERSLHSEKNHSAIGSRSRDVEPKWNVPLRAHEDCSCLRTEHVKVRHNMRLKKKQRQCKRATSPSNSRKSTVKSPPVDRSFNFHGSENDSFELSTINKTYQMQTKTINTRLGLSPIAVL